MKIMSGGVTVNNKKYPYTIKKKNNDVVFVECEAAKISQEFPAEDLADLLLDMPSLIIAEKEYQKKQSEVVRFRIAPNDKRVIEKKAAENGFQSVSEYMRHLALCA